MSDISVQPQHPLVELLAKRLFGITTVPEPEQRRMVHRACKAAAEYHDSEIKRLRAENAKLQRDLAATVDSIMQSRGFRKAVREAIETAKE